MIHPWKTVAAMAAVSAGLCLAQVGSVRQGGPGAGARQMRTKQSNFLATYLGLTDSQKEQQKAIFDSSAEATRALRAPLKQAHDALQAAIKANRSDSELEQLSASVGSLQGQLTAIQAKSQAKFYALLTPEQRDKLAQMPGGMGSGPGGPGMGRIPRFGAPVR